MIPNNYYCASPFQWSSVTVLNSMDMCRASKTITHIRHYQQIKGGKNRKHCLLWTILNGGKHKTVKCNKWKKNRENNTILWLEIIQFWYELVICVRCTGKQRQKLASMRIIMPTYHWTTALLKCCTLQWKRNKSVLQFIWNIDDFNADH